MTHPHRALGIAAAALILFVASAACGAADPVRPAAPSVPFASTTSAPASTSTVPPSSAVVATPEPVAPAVVAAAALPVARRAPVTTRAAATPAPKPAPKPTPKPAPKPKPAAASSGCNGNYTPCVPNDPKDVDCQGGSGNGPSYVAGPVRVTGSDVYGLDADKDGIGCE